MPRIKKTDHATAVNRHLDLEALEPRILLDTSFGPQQVITWQADSARSVYAADLDGDGDADVLSGSYLNETITWYENLGGGVFGGRQVITTAAQGAQSVYACDLDGDGDADVLSASELDDKVAWYENLGAGAFGAQQVITTAANRAKSVYATDLDGDGDADVLSASYWDSKIAWYENLGGGSFGAQRVITTATDWATSVYACDLDGDGDADVVSSSEYDDKIAWYENLSAGTFGAQQVITASADGAASVYATDLDGDGDTDVLSASMYDDKIAWYENLGAGAFGTQQVISISADGARSVYATDLDADGDVDVLSASTGDDRIAWYENLGTGNFGAQQSIATAASSAMSVYASDLDGDGNADVLSASMSDNKIAWYESLLAGGENTPPQIGAFLLIPDPVMQPANLTLEADDVTDPDPGDIVEMVAFYLDSNDNGTLEAGTDELLGTDTSSSGGWKWEGSSGRFPPGENRYLARAYDGADWSSATSALGTVSGTGRFGAQQVITTSANSARSVYATDLDGDGDGDVLSASYYDGKVAWYENLGGGSFGAQQVITTAAQGAQSVYAFDLDGDGDADVLSAVSLDNEIAWYENLGGATFGGQQVITTAAQGAQSVHACDLDGDGDADVLSASMQDGKITWYENLGAGAFGTPQVITTAAQGAQSVYACDLDADGDVDVLSASDNWFGQDKIAWYENLGGGSFGAQEVITTSARGAAYVYATDLDGDGDPDVLSASTRDDKIAWYENLGAGSFGAQQVIAGSAQGATSVYATDLDGDGDADVLSASRSDDEIAWYENLGGGSFGAQQVIAGSAQGATSVYATDLDGDGDADVLSASWEDDKIAWYENLMGEGAAGPRITGHSPSGTVSGGVDHMDVVFNEGISGSTFTTSDVTISGPDGGIAPTGVSFVSGNTYRISFASQSTAGAYTVYVGPYVQDLAGNYMDQDQDGINGEATQDRYTGTFSVEPVDVQPALGLVGPSSSVTVEQGEGVTISWADSDPDDNAQISLAYDADDSSMPWSDSDHVWITQTLREDPEGPGDEYEWDTSDVPPGTYTIWGIIDDGTNEPVYSRAAGRVTVEHDLTVVFDALRNLADEAEDAVEAAYSQFAQDFGASMVRLRDSGWDNFRTALGVLSTVVGVVSGSAPSSASALKDAFGLATTGAAQAILDLSDFFSIGVTGWGMAGVGFDPGAAVCQLEDWFFAPNPQATDVDYNGVRDNRDYVLDTGHSSSDIAHALYLDMKSGWTYVDEGGTPLPQSGFDAIASLTDAEVEAYITDLQQTAPHSYPTEVVVDYVAGLRGALQTSQSYETFLCPVTDRAAERARILGSYHSESEGISDVLGKLDVSEGVDWALTLAGVGAAGVGVAKAAGAIASSGVSIAAEVVIGLALSTGSLAQGVYHQNTEEVLQQSLNMELLSVTMESIDMADIVFESVGYLRDLQSSGWAALDVDNAGAEVVDGTFKMEDVTIQSGKVSADVGGSISVENGGTDTLPARAYVFVYPGGAPEDEFLPSPIMVASSGVSQLSPGVPQVFNMQTALFGSSQLKVSHYHAYAYVSVGPAIKSRLIGPAFDDFEVDSDSVLGQIGDWLSDAWHSVLGEGETWETEHQIAPEATGCYIMLQFPGSDLDLHIYDSSGNHVGVDYVTGLVDSEIEGAEYTGTAGLLERIYLPASGDEVYTIRVVGVEADGQEPFAVVASDVPQQEAIITVTPSVVHRIVENRSIPLEVALSVREIGGQTDYVGLAASSSDLVSAAGAIPASNVHFEVSDTTIDAGGAAEIVSSVSLPAGLSSGVYSGTFYVGSQSVDVPIALELLNAPPEIGSLTDAPDPVTQPANLTLTADYVSDSDPGDSVEKVEFYLDDGDGTWGAGDSVLGTDPDGGDGWSITVDSDTLPTGLNTYFARAYDGELWSAEKSTTGTVDPPPGWELIASHVTDRVRVSFYDTDPSDGVSEPDIAWHPWSYSLGTDILVVPGYIGDCRINAIVLLGYAGATRDLAVVLEQATGYNIGLYSLIDARVSAAPLECLLCQGDIGAVFLQAALDGDDVNAFESQEDWQPVPDIASIPAADVNDVGIYAASSIGPVTVLGEIAGDLITASGSIRQVLTVDGDVAASVLAPNGAIASVIAYMGDIDLRGGRQILSQGTINAIYAIGANWAGGDILGDVAGGAANVSIDSGSLWSLQAIGGSIEGLRVDVDGGWAVTGQIGTVAASGGSIEDSSFASKGLAHVFTTGWLEDTDINVSGTLNAVTVLGRVRRSDIHAGNVNVVQTGWLEDTHINVNGTLDAVTVLGNMRRLNISAGNLGVVFTTGWLEDTDVNVPGSLDTVTALGDMRRTNIHAGNLGVVQMNSLGHPDGSVEYQIGEEASDGWWLLKGWGWEHVYGEKTYLDTAR